MQAEDAAFPVGDEVAQGQRDGAESDFVPGKGGRVEQRDLEGFVARGKVQIEQPGAKHQMHLTDVRHGNHGVQRAELDARAALLGGLAPGGLGDAFPVFHEARRQRPAAAARLDGAPAQEDAILPHRQGANHQAGIAVMDCATGLADMPRQGIARRNAQAHGRSASRAEIDLGLHAAILTAPGRMFVRWGDVANIIQYKQCINNVM